MTISWHPCCPSPFQRWQRCNLCKCCVYGLIFPTSLFRIWMISFSHINQSLLICGNFSGVSVVIWLFRLRRLRFVALRCWQFCKTYLFREFYFYFILSGEFFFHNQTLISFNPSQCALPKGTWKQPDQLCQPVWIFWFGFTENLVSSILRLFCNLLSFPPSFDQDFFPNPKVPRVQQSHYDCRLCVFESDLSHWAVSVGRELFASKTGIPNIFFPKKKKQKNSDLDSNLFPNIRRNTFSGLTALHDLWVLQ